MPAEAEATAIDALWQMKPAPTAFLVASSEKKKDDKGKEVAYA